jgi:hypothetical protein
MPGKLPTPSRGPTQQSPSMPDHISRSASSRLSPNPSSLTIESPKMRLVFERPADGTELVRTVSGSNPPTTVEVRFEPLSPTEQLVGQPTPWCNTPGPGQALVYAVPVTVGGTTSGTLTVSVPSSGIITQIPIKVKHNV